MPGAGVRVDGGRWPPFVTAAQVEEAAIAALREASARSQSRIKDVLLHATDSRGFVGRKDTGLAHSAVGSSAPQVIGAGRVRTVTGIGPPRDAIASVLEEGRRPGKRMPPPDALKPWARRKLRDRVAANMKGARVTLKSKARFDALKARAGKFGKTLGKGTGPRVTGVGKARLEAAVDQLAFVVARSIGRKGFPGLHPFKRARVAMDKELDGIFRRHLRRVLSKGRRA